MTRSRNRQEQRPDPSPFDAAVLADEKQAADQLSEIMQAVADYDQGTVKAVLYKKPFRGQGAYEWIDEIFPPFDLPAMFADLKERFGGGDYQLRVFGGGRIRKNVDFTIAKEKDRPAIPAPVAAGFGGNMAETLFTLMMTQAADARREAAAAAERQTNMIVEMNKSQTNLLAAVLGNRGGGGTSETVALIEALGERRGGGGGIKETIEAMAAMKQLLGDGGGGEEHGLEIDTDNLVASGARLIGPALKSLSDYLARQRDPAGPSASGAADPAAVGNGSGGQLALGPAGSRWRLIELVKVDVTYGFERGHDPQKIADLVYDVIEANNATEEEITQLAATFALSPTGLDDLAAEGIDLRARPQWAAEFFDCLVAIHSGEADDSEREPGRETDAAGNGQPGQAGAERPAH